MAVFEGFEQWQAFAVVLASVIFLHLLLNRRKHMKINSPPALPLLGSTLALMGPPEKLIKVIRMWIGRYGRRFRFKMGTLESVVIANAADMEKVLTSKIEIEKGVEYERMVPWVGRGLVTSWGQKWFHRRRMITPAFHFNILEQFFPILNEQADVLINILKRRVNNGFFDIQPLLTRYALDVICETSMGLELGSQNEIDNPYCAAIREMSMLQFYRMVRPWYHPQWLWNLFGYGHKETSLIKTLKAFTRQVIKDRRAILKNSAAKATSEDDGVYGKRKRLALLDLLLEAQEAGNDFDDTGVQEEIDTFMFAGHDTTTTTACFLLFNLGNHAEIQDKVYKEQLEIFGEDKNAPVTSAMLRKMSYLDMCIKESLRIYPTAWLISRRPKADMKLDDDYTVPKNAEIMIDIMDLHKDPKYFPNADKYDPERFNADNVSKRHPFAFLPFSAGPRNCIGQKFAMMETKAIISHIIRNFRVCSKFKPQEVTTIPTGVLGLKQGFPLAFYPR